jgi:NADP-dependent 3-hydroxy acid dehydrogenase YdfG
MALSRELSGRVALVTGASSGIGLATAARLAQSGAQVVLVARDVPRLEAAQERIGAGACVCACDVTDPSSAEHMGAALAQCGTNTPDIIVHAAGAFALAPIGETSIAAFDRALAVNLRAAFLLMHAYLPRMLDRGTGDFVTIGSVAGRHAFPSNGAYSASKFGVRGLHAVLAAELRGTGVRASLVEPAATDTPLWDAIDRERNADLPPRAAMLSPVAVAEAVHFAVTRPRDVAAPNILMERS